MDVQEQILEALVQRDVEQYLQDSTDPRGQKIFQEMMLHAQNAIIAAMEQDGEPQNAIDAAVHEFTAGLQLMNPRVANVDVYRVLARKKYVPKQTLEDALRRIENTLDLNTVEDPHEAALMDSLRAGVSHTGSRVLAELVSIAGANGLPYALTPEAQYEAIKKIFPTREAYLFEKRSQLQRFLAMFNTMSRLLAKSPSADHQLSSIACAAISDMFKGFGEMYELVHMERAEAKADKIYGPGVVEDSP